MVTIRSTSCGYMYIVSMVAVLAILIIFILKATVTPRPCKGKQGGGFDMFKCGKLHALKQLPHFLKILLFCISGKGVRQQR